MANSGLRGTFPLTNDGVKNNVVSSSPGAYALGEKRDGTFYISYVGRSDTEVGRRLLSHIGKHTAFKYEYYDSPKAAIAII